MNTDGTESSSTSSLNPETLAFLQERSRARQREGVSENIRLIKEWTRAGLGIISDAYDDAFSDVHGDIHITVSELACADPSCPIRETVILVLTEPAQQWKIGKPIRYVRKYDVALALERTGGDGLSIRPHQ